MNKAMTRANECEKYFVVCKDAFVEGYELREQSDLQGMAFREQSGRRAHEIEITLGSKHSASFNAGIQMAEIDMRVKA